MVISYLKWSRLCCLWLLLWFMTFCSMVFASLDVNFCLTLTMSLSHILHLFDEHFNEILIKTYFRTISWHSAGTSTNKAFNDQVARVTFVVLLALVLTWHFFFSYSKSFRSKFNTFTNKQTKVKCKYRWYKTILIVRYIVKIGRG